MKLFVVMLVLAAVVAVSIADYSSLTDLTGDDVWINYFKIKNAKLQSQQGAPKKVTAPTEEKKKAVMSSHAHVLKCNQDFNTGKTSHTCAMNDFSDLTPQEMKAMTGAVVPTSRMKQSSASNTAHPSVSAGTAPSSFDWRTKGVISPVKNQGQCGCCWVFSSTSTLEAYNAMRTGNIVTASEQQLTDCVKPNACGGGWMTEAFSFIKSKGVAKTDGYRAYTATNTTCGTSTNKVPGTVTGYVDLPQQDANSMKNYVGTTGPLNIALFVSPNFQSYKSGILNDTTCPKDAINHAVVIVGYGTENGKDYWIVKNSWGTGWGEQGYIRIARGSNMCNCEKYAGHPTVTA